MNCKATIRHPPGYTLAGVMVLIAIMSILMAMSLPVWDRIKQRENEEELIFRGKEYMEAIGRYHAKFHSYPPDTETLLKMKFIRKLYKDPMTEKGDWKLLHPDSLVETGEAGFVNQPGGKKSGETDDDKKDPKTAEKKEVVPGLKDTKKDETEEDTFGAGEEKSVGPVVGVVSRSKKNSLRIYNGQSSYDKWLFAYVPEQEEPQQPEAPEKPDKKQDKGKDGKKPPTPTPPKKPPG